MPPATPIYIRYVGNNPLNATDPLGLSKTTVLDVALVGGGLIIGGIGLVSSAPLVGAIGAVLAVAGAVEYVGRRTATSEWNVGKPVRARKPTECEQRQIDRHDADEIVRLIEKLEELERLDDRILTRLRHLPTRTNGDWDRFVAEYRAAGGPIVEIGPTQRDLNNLRRRK